MVWLCSDEASFVTGPRSSWSAESPPRSAAAERPCRLRRRSGSAFVLALVAALVAAIVKGERAPVVVGAMAVSLVPALTSIAMVLS